MPNSMGQPDQSGLVRSLDTLRPTMAKAVRSSDRAFNQVVTTAVIAHYGSVKAASISLNVDASLMMREFQAGKFDRLNQADDETKAAVADALKRAWPMGDPKAVARRELESIENAVRTIRQFVDHVA